MVGQCGIQSFRVYHRSNFVAASFVPNVPVILVPEPTLLLRLLQKLPPFLLNRIQSQHSVLLADCRFFCDCYMSHVTFLFDAPLIEPFLIDLSETWSSSLGCCCSSKFRVNAAEIALEKGVLERFFKTVFKGYLFNFTLSFPSLSLFPDNLTLRFFLVVRAPPCSLIRAILSNVGLMLFLETHHEALYILISV